LLKDQKFVTMILVSFLLETEKMQLQNLLSSALGRCEKAPQSPGSDRPLDADGQRAYLKAAGWQETPLGWREPDVSPEGPAPWFLDAAVRAQRKRDGIG
jgi:hypothetical protein